MQVRPVSIALFIVLVFGLGLCGCLPSGHSQLDEEKESHFLAGKARLHGYDYQGALECFEKAIEANPRSGVAHFEAGLLCEKYKQDHAAAIYHFDRFLELHRDSPYGEVVKQHILACKQELAKSVNLMPITQSLQKEFEQLSQQNKMLREEVEAWRAKAHAQSVTGYSGAAASSGTTVSPAPASAPAARSSSITNSIPSARPALSASSGRTHTIRSGETPVAIARRYGIKLDLLMAANPRLDARKLRVGQSVIVPMQ